MTAAAGSGELPYAKVVESGDVVFLGGTIDWII
jgi:hypothetical protein